MGRKKLVLFCQQQQRRPLRISNNQKKNDYYKKAQLQSLSYMNIIQHDSFINVCN